MSTKLSLTLRAQPRCFPSQRTSYRDRLTCKAEERTLRLPRTPGETADQAVTAAQTAFNDGLTKQRIEFLPPLTGATEIDDWPGGIRQMFNAILPTVERFLVGVKRTDTLQCTLQSQLLDEGDATALWSGEHLKALLFPTPEALIKARSMDPQDVKLFLLINPQWQEGQVISDFGFGQRKQEIESFLRDFQYTYFLKTYRIEGLGIRVLRCYPNDWCILLTDKDGQEFCLSEEKEKPTYKRMEKLLQEKGLMSGSLFEKLKKEFDFNIQSIKEP